MTLGHFEGLLIKTFARRLWRRRTTKSIAEATRELGSREMAQNGDISAIFESKQTDPRVSSYLETFLNRAFLAFLREAKNGQIAQIRS